MQTLNTFNKEKIEYGGSLSQGINTENLYFSLGPSWLSISVDQTERGDRKGEIKATRTLRTKEKPPKRWESKQVSEPGKDPS